MKKLIEENNSLELNQLLSNTWDSVWSDTGELNYANLRLFKTVDKIKKIVSANIDFNNKKVLDIGCGNGTTLIYLKKFYNIVGVGIDISQQVINDLKKNISDSSLSFLKGDHRNLNVFKNNQFDIILSFGVLEHFDEYGLALAEARRVLKQNGKLILIQPHLFSFGVIQELLLRLAGKWKFGNQKNFSCFYYKKLLREAGYKNIFYFTTPPYQDMKVTRFFDTIFKNLFSYWGHYLYLIAKK
ncbi:MAG: methyltransferase domain-containing protein [Patescibacteria group bacterium]|jgi:ubiquinone/menaquinone biosynthesis C-methylase UbiE|nr:methyltransferase domain-containing protein [Patescibacteria group bacterium]